MFQFLATAAFRVTGRPALQVYGKGRRETNWRIIDVRTTHRRDLDSSWPRPFFPGTCITWTSSVVAVGWDFAEMLLREQMIHPASPERPLEVRGGRILDYRRRVEAGGSSYPSHGEIMAHEIGHTWQARRLDLIYWPLGAMFTLCREGNRWYNFFENQASEEGLFGGIVPGSICEALEARLPR